MRISAGACTADQPQVDDPGVAGHPTPRLSRVITAACDTFEATEDRALRELLAELILALGHDQDTRVEMAAEDAARWLEALRQVRELRS